MIFNRKTLILLRTLNESLVGSTHSGDYIHNVAESYYNQINHHVVNKGKQHAAKFYKEMFLFCRNIALGLELPAPVPFTKTDKDGIPKVIKPLVPLLTGSNDDKRVGLTIARFYESIYCKTDYGTENVTSQYIGDCTQDFQIKFGKFLKNKIPLVFGTIPSPYGKYSIVNRLVAGPNGPAMLTSHYDALAVMDNPQLREAMFRLAGMDKGFHP